MKTALTIVFVLLLTTLYGQSNVFLDSAKAVFAREKDMDSEEYYKVDYVQVASLLELAIAQDPGNTEARYFLGYAYSRINSRDGRGMIDSKLPWVFKASEQFEKVNKLTPRYKGEIVTLDPYSKLSAEWGTIAFRYLYNNRTDSAIWAFKEGKKRGGFGNFFLEVNRKVLDACSPNSILVSSGDNCTIPLWYLQTVDGYRKDVAVIDVSLLNTSWYQPYLAKNKIVTFDLPDAELDSLDIIEWADSTITINNFSWTVKPSYYDQYVLRGDLILLSLLRQNKFKRDLHFTMGFSEEFRVGLGEHITSFVVTDKVITSGKSTMEYNAFKKSSATILQTAKYLSLNSADELWFYDIIRFRLLEQITKFITNDDREKAKELMTLLDKYGHESKFPYQSTNGLEYVNYLRGELK